MRKFLVLFVISCTCIHRRPKLAPASLCFGILPPVSSILTTGIRNMLTTLSSLSSASALDPLRYNLLCGQTYTILQPIDAFNPTNSARCLIARIQLDLTPRSQHGRRTICSWRASKGSPHVHVECTSHLAVCPQLDLESLDARPGVGGQSNLVRDSLYVKFDPLVGRY